MFLAHAMDDTNLTSIRRSIFLFSSFIAFTAYYGLEFQSDAKLFGFLQTTNATPITSQTLVLCATFAQLYLCIRLYFARPIALALLHKSWGIEELKGDDAFKALIGKIEKMVESSGKVDYPRADDIENIESVLNATQSKILSLSEKSASTNKELALIGRQFQNISEKTASVDDKFRLLLKYVEAENKSEYHKILEGAFSEKGTFRDKDGNPMIGSEDPQLSPIVRQIVNEYRSFIPQDLRRELEKKNEETVNLLKTSSRNTDKIQQCLNMFNKHVEYCSTFPVKFAESDLKKSIDGISGELVDVKDKKKVEFEVFEFWMPLLIACGSILFGSNYSLLPMLKSLCQ